ncbi:MAG TPA: peptidylprolyl isomerase, partial [Propionibacteriaceae bacterium]|nr:peptidylprolyl isomerase [Propionibacteriaceae bacterium]
MAQQTATLHTNHGDINLVLFGDQAPKTVDNFVGLASGTKEYTDPQTGERKTGKFYDGL